VKAPGQESPELLALRTLPFFWTDKDLSKRPHASYFASKPEKMRKASSPSFHHHN
jgi:hypothetical protein